MGLGKTFVGSEKMMDLGNTVNLMICQHSKIDDWMEHFKDHYSEHPYLIEVFNLAEKKQLERFMSLSKQNDDLNPCQFIGIINYDLVFRRPELLKLEGFTLMLDESSVIQNETTKRSKFVLKTKAANVILLSGTPTSGKYEKLWSQLHLLGWNISKDLFWKQYVEVEWLENDDGFPIRRVVGYKNVERLKAKLRQHGAVFMKSEEVFDLPEQVPIKIHVKTTKEYRKFIRTSIVEIGDIELIGDSVLTKRLYSRMLCGHYNQDKLDALKDLIDSTEDRLIIFYNFNPEFEAIKILVGDRPLSIVNGAEKNLTAFNEHDDSITLVQYQAGSAGINLQKACRVVYFTLPQSCEHFMQSKKRIHRIGQTKTCFYYFMMCKDSIEESIMTALERGVDYTDALFEEYEKSN